jgi:eukaryotic translation initiation factor 2C
MPTVLMRIVVLGKRHHTRFYPTDAANADQNGNPKAGTVVDRGGKAFLYVPVSSTEPNSSHGRVRLRLLSSSARRTSRHDAPHALLRFAGRVGLWIRAHHDTVVWDENQFTANQMQSLTHEVSYLFARATKAVKSKVLAYRFCAYDLR